jgi:hypothetical protein
MDGMGVRDVHSLYQSESNPATIYAGTNHGLFRSDDHGRTWAQVKKEVIEEQSGEKDKAESSNGKAEQSADQTVAQPKAQPEAPSPRPRRVVAVPEENPIKPVVLTLPQPDQPKAAANKNRGKVQAKARTKPPGKNARAASKSKSQKEKTPPLPPAPTLIDLQSQVFAIVPYAQYKPESNNDGEKATPSNHGLIASTWDGLFRAEDEKKGWKELKLRKDASTPNQPKINTIAASPRSPGAIFVGTDEGLFVSRNNGESFKLMLLEDEVRRVRSIVFDPRTADTIYVGASTGFFRSFDGGRSWENRGGGMPLVTDVSAIVISAANPDELYLSDELRGSFYHSKDRGRNWERLDISQLPSLKLWSLASDPFDANRIYAGSFSGGVYVMSRK